MSGFIFSLERIYLMVNTLGMPFFTFNARTLSPFSYFMDEFCSFSAICDGFRNPVI